MDQQAIITLFLAVVALSLKPGPGMMMVMSRAISQGMPSCLAFIAGWLLVLFVYLLIVFASFNIVDLDMVFILILIKAMAASYLIWLGVKGLQESEAELHETPQEQESLFDSFSAGAVLTFANPLAIVFYAGILPTLVDISTMNFNDMFIITFIVLGVEGILPIIYCAPLAVYRRKVPLEFLKGLRIFASIMMILVGLYIGYTAIPADDLTSVF